MLKKVVCLVLAALLLTGSSLAESRYTGILDGMGEDELLGLYQEISERITIAKSSDAVYDQDGISIVWYGVQHSGQFGQFSFLFFNHTDHDYEFKLTDGAINGFLTGISWNTYEVDIPAGFSFLTTSKSNWEFSWSTIETLGIQHADTISLLISLKDKKSKESKTLTVTFAVDEEIPD